MEDKRRNILSNFLISHLYSSERQELYSYGNLLVPTQFIGRVANFFANPSMMSSVKFGASDSTFDLTELIYRFLFVLDSVSHRLSNQIKEQLEENYSNYIKNMFQVRTITVLHAAITNFRVKLRPIRLILRLGAEVTATNR
jgi:hypothetical protein